MALNQVWGKFKDENFKMRMFLWDSLVLGVLLYGVELRGFRERERERESKRRSGTTTAEVHQIDTWIEYENTGLYIVLEKTKREKIRAGRRVLKECLREKEEG